VCYPSFDGIYCDQKAEKNIDTPKFDKPFYNATILENSPVGTPFLKVHANDSDPGRNGRVFYSLAGDKGVGNAFAVDAKTGIVYNVHKLDYETLKEFSSNITIIATDDGVPQRSASTVVQITVMDENDNCPSFTQPVSEKIEIFEMKTGDVITQVSAFDLDSRINSDITYSISENDAFSVHPKTGIITVKSTATQALYDLTVSAEDNGIPPCRTKTVLTISIRGFTTSQPSTDAPSSHPTTKTTEKATKTKAQSSSTEFTEPTTNSDDGGDFESTTWSTTLHFPTEATAVPQKSRIYIVIGCSAFGGVLVLVIVALVVTKFVCKRKVNHGFPVQGTGHINSGFELSVMSKTKM